jgi:hypothetical protein
MSKKVTFGNAIWIQDPFSDDEGSLDEQDEGNYRLDDGAESSLTLDDILDG